MAREKRKWEVDDGTTAEQKRGGRGAITVPPGLGFFKTKKTGSHEIDIVPFMTTEHRDRYIDKMRYSSKRGVLYPERTYWVHYGVGINNDSVACASRNFGKPCPMCQARNKFLDETDKESQQKADALKPKQRQLFLVFDRDEPDKGVQLWEVSQYLFGRHVEDYIEGTPKAKKPEFRQYYHPEKGKTIRVTCKEGTTGENQFTDFLVHSMYDRESPVPEEIFDHEYDLDAMVQCPDYDATRRLFLGLDEGEDDDKKEESAEDVDEKENDEQGDDGPTPPSRNGAKDHDPRPPIKRHMDPPPPPQTPKGYVFASRDRVSVDYKGETVEGVIEKVDLDSKMASVKLEGRDRPTKFDFSDLTLLEADDTFDLKDPPPEEESRTFKGKPAGKGKPADDDNDPVPPAKGKGRK